MSESLPVSTHALRVAAGADLFGEQRGMGINTIDFKTISTEGGLFIIENTLHAKGGPARHLHLHQDEWFYVLEGEFVMEVGDKRMTLLPGDSVFAPRTVPHVWANVGASQGKLLIAFTPAGQMEAFFREVTKTNAMPIQDPALWHAHGMKLIGPPLPVE